MRRCVVNQDTQHAPESHCACWVDHVAIPAPPLQHAATEIHCDSGHPTRCCRTIHPAPDQARFRPATHSQNHVKEYCRVFFARTIRAPPDWWNQSMHQCDHCEKVSHPEYFLWHLSVTT